MSVFLVAIHYLYSCHVEEKENLRQKKLYYYYYYDTTQLITTKVRSTRVYIYLCYLYAEILFVRSCVCVCFIIELYNFIYFSFYFYRSFIIFQLLVSSSCNSSVIKGTFTKSYHNNGIRIRFFHVSCCSYSRNRSKGHTCTIII